jgi:acetyl esterase/lipase
MAQRTLSQRAASALVNGLFGGLAGSTALLPVARPGLHGVDRTRNILYRQVDCVRLHLVDLYRPKGVSGPLPVALYAHGGGLQGLQGLSKETHWLMGLLLRAGVLRSWWWITP